MSGVDLMTTFPSPPLKRAAHASESVLTLDELICVSKL
jgi:hypothetical protein